LKPCGIADLTASTASEAVAHITISRNDFFLVSAATSTIDQIRLKIEHLGFGGQIDQMGASVH
jgi:hypothetical protein